MTVGKFLYSKVILCFNYKSKRHQKIIKKIKKIKIKEEEGTEKETHTHTRGKTEKEERNSLHNKNNKKIVFKKKKLN